MGYILMKLDNSKASKVALTKLIVNGNCDFDLSQSGAQLYLIAFNSRTCSYIERHYHDFVGEISCG